VSESWPGPAPTESESPSSRPSGRASDVVPHSSGSHAPTCCSSALNPSAKARAWGSLPLRERLSRLDHSGTPSYLEATTPATSGCLPLIALSEGLDGSRLVVGQWMDGDLQIGSGRLRSHCEHARRFENGGCGSLGEVQGPVPGSYRFRPSRLSQRCQQRGLDPLAATRPQVELYVRWLQEVRRFKASTVSRRTSVVAGFYRTCVIDGVLEHSPAEHVRRPNVPPESPTLGLTHLQFKAMLAASRQSTNDFDFALVTLLGLLGLRIFEATGGNIDDLGEEHGHRVLRVRGKGGKVVLVPLPPAVGRAIERATGDRRSGPILLNSRGARMDRHCATRRLRNLADQAGVRLPRMHPHMLRHTFVTTMLDAGVDLRDVQIAARHADPRTTMRYDRARKNLDRHPNYILAAYVASGT